jgi:FtsP/CotA-like multicopper oxidase with cupredoxin domain
VDTDGDGVDNNLDNCITVANADQRDTNGNQIGNVCDADFNGDGIVDAFDIPLFRTAFGQSTFPNEDMNGDGIVDAFDIPLFRAAFGNPPGPSCAGLFYGCVAPLDPLAIPKYVLPLVIPPAMNPVGGPGGAPDNYEIAVKQFQQQILPGGHWNAVSAKCIADPTLCTFPATTVWSYGPAADPLPDSSGIPGGAVGLAPAPNSQYNYPAYTIETTNGGRGPLGNYLPNPISITWINGLKENFGAGPNFLPHLLPIDQTLHWANPKADCIAGSPRTDCMGPNPNYYKGPVPLVVHVHGGHNNPQSDGYTEAWYLPDPTGSNFNCTNNPAVAANPQNPNTYVCGGSLINQLGVVTNPAPNAAGFANFTYDNDQPSTTIWYHDHALGMTRSNVYAGPAGFFLIRQPSGGEDGLVAGVLPGPAPVRGQDVLSLNIPGNPVRSSIREIPIAVQDRSFNADGSLFYPADRAFFEGLGDGFGNIEGQYNGNAAAGLNVDFIPSPTSDMPPIWNPEAFFNTMVVNGSTWPELQVAPAQYRFRLLNGCNSRFINLALIVTDPVTGAQTTVNRTVWDDTTVPPTASTVPVNELSFFQIGTEQSILPQVVKVETGAATQLPGDGTIPAPVAAPAPQQALLMGNAERPDVIVDFRGLPDGTVVRVINTGPDEPFGGFDPASVPADPATTGQVMQFVVNSALLGSSPTDELRAPDGTLQNPLTRATPPESLVLGPADNPLPNTQILRRLALLEEESALVCVTIDGVTGEITQVPGDIPPCVTPEAEAFAPLAAVLGTVNQGGVPTVQLWSDPISTNPALGATEAWQLQNFSADAHPVHLHLVKFNVLGREALGGGPSVGGDPLNGGINAWENGWKDVVISYPGEATTVAATFDIPGLYVWHCHIVEHEDNEMMVPFCVGNTNCGGLPLPAAATQAAFTTGLTP